MHVHALCDLGVSGISMRKVGSQDVAWDGYKAFEGVTPSLNVCTGLYNFVSGKDGARVCLLSCGVPQATECCISCYSLFATEATYLLG